MTDEAQASTNYKEAFSLFDRRGTGTVSVDLLGDLLRACGQNPTLEEIDTLEKSFDGDCKFCATDFSFSLLITIVEYESFLKVLNRADGFRDPGDPMDYCRGFQVFDKDSTGFIGIGQLKYSTFFRRDGRNLANGSLFSLDESRREDVRRGS